jgi:hypothetical protein
LAALTALCLSAARPADAQNYVFQTVDAPGRSFFDEIPILTFTFINDTGLVTQQYFGPEPPVGLGHTALLHDGVWTILDVPGSTFCGCSRPNARGQVALGYAFADGVLHTAIWQRGAYSPFPDIPGYTLFPNAINNSGKLAGVAVDADGREHGFVGDAQRYAIFDHPLASPGTAPYSLNDAGTVIGWYDAPDGTTQSFKRDGEQFETIAAPGSLFSLALTINNAGVIGGAYLDSDFIAHGFLLRNGTYTRVDVPGAAQTKIDSVNDRGEIAGGYIGVDGSVHGFVAKPIPGP